MYNYALRIWTSKDWAKKNRESKTIFDTTRKGNLPIAINKMTYDAFTLFIQLLQLERLSAFHH